jgi:predicted XRE-type DNA-binding protein
MTMKTELKHRKTDDGAVIRGSTNLFEDLGFSKDEASDLKVKAELGLRIHNRVKELRLTQVKAAGQLGISQPDVSRLLNGQFDRFTIDKLLVLLNALEVDIDIVIRPRAHRWKIRRGVVRVMEATV